MPLPSLEPDADAEQEGLVFRIHHLCQGHKSAYFTMCGRLGEIEWVDFDIQGAKAAAGECSRALPLEQRKNYRREIDNLRSALGLEAGGSVPHWVRRGSE